MKVKIIIPYFGKLPCHFQLFLDSCKNNPNFNWILFTDDKTDYNYPCNFRVIYSSFDQISKLIQGNFNFSIVCHKPYKLCDFKPAYGEIFSEYLEGCDYWGYCDIDLLWGDLSKFLAPILDMNYDKILNYGHLSLYKNNKIVNSCYKLKFNGINYKYVYSFNHSFGFDEHRGINKLMLQNGFKIWSSNIMVDIYRQYENPNLIAYNHYNYSKQTFIIDNKGSLKHIYELDNQFYEKEYMYLHFQKRQMKTRTDSIFNLEICSDGFSYSNINDYNSIEFEKDAGIKPKNWFVKIIKDKIDGLLYRCHYYVYLIQRNKYQEN